MLYRRRFFLLGSITGLLWMFNNCSGGEFQSVLLSEQLSSSQPEGESSAPVDSNPDGSNPMPDPTPLPDPVVFQPLPPVPASTELCAVTSGDSELKKAARQVAVGDWIKVPVSYEGDVSEGAFFRSSPYPETGGVIQSTGHLDWADNASWDPHTRCIYFYGGGHLTQPAFIRLCEGDLKWSYVKRPSAIDYASSNMWSYALHAYEYNTIDPVSGIHYLAYKSELHAYDTRKMEWTVRSKLAKNTGFAGTSMAFVPGLGVLETTVNTGGDGSMSIDLLKEGASVWTNIGANIENIKGGYFVSQYNPKSKVMVFGGGRDSVTTGPLWKLGQDGSMSKIRYAPEQLVTSGSPSNNFVDDPASGNFIYTIASSGTIYEYLTSQDGWTVRGKVPFDFTRAKISTSIPGYDVIAYYVMGQGLWLYNPNRKPCP